ncbi:hypothetical protein GCM10017752_11270 [Streptomyces roseoviridis]
MEPVEPQSIPVVSPLGHRKAGDDAHVVTVVAVSHVVMGHGAVGHVVVIHVTAVVRMVGCLMWVVASVVSARVMITMALLVSTMPLVAMVTVMAAVPGIVP